MQALPLVLFLHLLSVLSCLSQFIFCDEVSILIEDLGFLLVQVLRNSTEESIADRVVFILKTVVLFGLLIDGISDKFELSDHLCSFCVFNC